MARSDIGELKGSLAESAQEEKGKFCHSKRKVTNPRARNWLEESWKSLEYFNFSHMGRIHATNDGNHSSKKDLDLDSEESYSVEESSSNVLKNGLKGRKEFTIPSLPCGKELTINIHTTWGDKYYVGLNGVEIFSDRGDLVPIAKVRADPSDLTVLPGCKNDPRVVENLLNGVNRTCDDVNMWLAPFTEGGSHFIYFTFEAPTRIAMIRIWNYNKSRIHSDRGAKAVTVTLDDAPIFCGEINKACGSVTPEGSFGDNILFTTDEAILEELSEHDITYDVINDVVTDEEDERPATGNDVEQEADDDAGSIVGDENAAATMQDTSGTYCLKCLQLNLISNWGDPQFIGLTGIQVLGESNDPIPIESHTIRDCTDVKASSPIQKLIDDTTITMSDDHMWSASFKPGSDPYSIEINFVQAMQVTGFRVWNYNQSFEDTYRGVKEISVKIDGRSLPNGKNVFILRRAPGNLHYDYAQDVMFENRIQTKHPASGRKINSVTTTTSLHYDVPYMPTGFVYKIELFDTWGDLYYVGLNGVELYNADGNLIDLTEKEIAAFPSSVNILGQNSDDIRTPDKLIDGVNDTREGQHMWLAPILPRQVNYVYIIFDTPQTVSVVKLWNYAKTPSRGVKNFAILVDDLLVYNGVLQSVPPPYESESVNAHSVVFSEDEELLQHTNSTTTPCESNEQDVRWNDHDRIIESRCAVDQGLRPTTSLVTSGSRVKARF